MPAWSSCKLAGFSLPLPLPWWSWCNLRPPSSLAWHIHNTHPVTSSTHPTLAALSLYLGVGQGQRGGALIFGDRVFPNLTHWFGKSHSSGTIQGGARFRGMLRHALQPPVDPPPPAPGCRRPWLWHVIGLAGGYNKWNQLYDRQLRPGKGPSRCMPACAAVWEHLTVPTPPKAAGMWRETLEVPSFFVVCSFFFPVQNKNM